MTDWRDGAVIEQAHNTNQWYVAMQRPGNVTRWRLRHTLEWAVDAMDIYWPHERVAKEALAQAEPPWWVGDQDIRGALLKAIQTVTTPDQLWPLKRRIECALQSAQTFYAIAKAQSDFIKEACDAKA